VILNPHNGSQSQMSNTKSPFAFPVFHYDSYPHPEHGDRGVVVHRLLVNAADIPADFPRDPNPRTPAKRRGLYLKVGESLRDGQGLFDLKNNGIYLFADEVKQRGKRVELVFADGDGVVNGGNTLTQIEEANAQGVLVGSNQHVEMKIITNCPNEWRVPIAGALNSSYQVRGESLANQEGYFDWIRDAIAMSSNPNFVGAIGYTENDKKRIYISTVLSMLAGLNADLFPINETPQPARVAYNNQKDLLKTYIKNIKSFERMSLLLTDILLLSDIIRQDCPSPLQQRQERQARKVRQPIVCHSTGEQAVAHLLRRQGGLTDTRRIAFGNSRGLPTYGASPEVRSIQVAERFQACRRNLGGRWA
jgi:hypothetical protein